MPKRMLPVFPKEGLQFLRSLKRNNNRAWFNARKALYERAVKRPMEDFAAALAEDFARFAPEVQVKGSVFRIYRDTRFSKDKSPYKTHAAASFRPSAFGRHEGAGFYFHIAPDEVWIGGGLYMPLPEDLRAVRSHIAENHEAFADIISNRRFKRLFGSVTGESLSRVPRGFPSNHPVAEFLMLKQYLAGRDVAPDAAVKPDFYKLLVETFETMAPFIRFINEPIVKLRRVRDRQSAVMADRL
jgi:uncharacterized protein (TIGR02453 family)